MADHRVARLGAGDWERGRAIRLRALEESPDAFGATLEGELEFTDQRWRDRVSRPDAVTFVTVSGAGEDIGLVVGAPYDDVAGLYSMWVAPEARGTGVGGVLVDRVVEWAAQEGVPRVFLDVGDDNFPAIALYKSRGFERTGATGSLAPPRDHIREHQRERVISRVS